MLRLASRDRLTSAGREPQLPARCTTAWSTTSTSRGRRRTPGGRSASAPTAKGATGRVLLGRVRAAPVAAAVRRRPRRAGRRHVQGSERPRASRSSASGSCTRRATSTSTCRPRGGSRRPTSGSTGSTRQSSRPCAPTARRAWSRCRSATARVLAAVWVVRAGRVTAAAARHRPARERPVGPRAVGAALRRQPGDAHPAGNRPGPRRRARAARARHRADRLAPQRGPRGVRRAPARARAHRSRAGRSRRPSRRCAGPRCSPPTRRCRRATTRSRSTWSRPTWPARGAAWATCATSSSRSAPTTTGTATARCST